MDPITFIESYLPSVNTMVAGKKNLDSFAWQAMFGALQLQPETHKITDSMVQKLQFIAVDPLLQQCGKSSVYDFMLSCSSVINHLFMTLWFTSLIYVFVHRYQINS